MGKLLNELLEKDVINDTDLVPVTDEDGVMYKYPAKSIKEAVATTTAGGGLLIRKGDVVTYSSSGYFVNNAPIPVGFRPKDNAYASSVTSTGKAPGCVIANASTNRFEFYAGDVSNYALVGSMSWITEDIFPEL